MGVLDVESLLRSMSSKQLQEWMAFYELHPFGQDYSDFLVAQLTKVMHNRWRGKNEPALQARDFLPLWREPEQTAEEQLSIFRRLVR